MNDYNNQNPKLRKVRIIRIVWIDRHYYYYYITQALSKNILDLLISQLLTVDLKFYHENFNKILYIGNENRNQSMVTYSWNIG